MLFRSEDFKNEGVVASGSWPFQVNLLKGGGAPIASTIPVEGATGWADTTMMHTDAPNPNCAYKWLEWSINPKLQGDLAAWFGSVPSVLAACEGNELLGAEGCTTNGLDNFDNRTTLFSSTRVEVVAPFAPAEAEVVEIRWIPLEECLRMVFGGEILDALTVAGLLAVKVRG